MLRIPLEKGCKNSILMRPPLVEPTVNSTSSNPKLVTPLTERLGDTIYREHRGLTGISRLLRWGCPATVSRKVAFVVVNSVKGVFGTWPWSHVSKEVLEVIPAFAYGYSSILVEANRLSNIPIATASHTTPHTMFGCMIKAVRGICRNSSLLLKTSATQGMTTSKVHKSNFHFLATVAFYKDLFMGISHRDFFDDKSAVSIPNSRSWFVHNMMISPISCYVKDIVI